MKQKIIQEGIASLLILLFVYAGLTKLMDFSTFKLQLEKSPFLNRFYLLAAWTIPFFELGIAGLLSFKKTRLSGFYLSFFLMFLFSGYIYSMLHYSSYLSCSCGGVLSIMSWEQHLVFNIVFTMLALVGILTHPSDSRNKAPLNNSVYHKDFAATNRHEAENL